MIVADAWEFFQNPALLAITLGCLIPIVAIVAGIWGSVQKNRSNNEFKRYMIERGMSADEIEQIMNAGDGSDGEDE